MMKHWFKFILIVLLNQCLSLMGQELPRGFAKGELSAMPAYLREVKSSALRNRVEFPNNVRSMAEWEELDGLIITWTDNFREIQREIVRNAQKECTVYIACNNPQTVRNYLHQQGIDTTENILCIQANYNSIWVRDFGPNSVYTTDNDSLIWVDWIYNRPRFRDDTLARTLANVLNIPLYETNTPPTDLVHTGGNYMSDGLGLAFSSELVLDENGLDNTFGQSNHSEVTIDSIMQISMGTLTYAKMTKLPYDGIHHIDMHMKILDEQNILVGKYEDDVADGSQINANIDYIVSNFKNTFGKPFNIHYIPMPPDANGRYPNNFGDYRTYTNSVIVNKTILVPFYDEKYDTTAQRIYETLMPGYKVIGIDCNKIIPSLGAIHCITKEVGSKDHMHLAVDVALPVIDANDEDARTVYAITKHTSGIREVWVYFRTVNSTGYDSIQMALNDAQLSMYKAVLPHFEDAIYYYFKAVAQSGKTQLRPMTAPEGYFTTKALETIATHDLVKPSIPLQVYPNPASALTYVAIQPVQTPHASISIIDNAGRHIKSIYQGPMSPVQNKFFFDVSDLLPGTYHVLVQSIDFQGQTSLIVR